MTEIEMHYGEALAWIRELEAFIHENGLDVPTWGDRDEVGLQPKVGTICTECGQTYEGDFHAYCPSRMSPPIVVVTPEQLDALPFLALIREIFKPSPSGTDYGGVYERRTSGWEPIAGVYKDAVDNSHPRLPCRVLYDPRTSV